MQRGVRRNYRSSWFTTWLALMSTFTLIGKVVGYSRGGHQPEGITPTNIRIDTSPPHVLGGERELKETWDRSERERRRIECSRQNVTKGTQIATNLASDGAKNEPNNPYLIRLFVTINVYSYITFALLYFKCTRFRHCMIFYTGLVTWKNALDLFLLLRTKRI